MMTPGWTDVFCNMLKIKRYHSTWSFDPNTFIKTNQTETLGLKFDDNAFSQVLSENKFA